MRPWVILGSALGYIRQGKEVNMRRHADWFRQAERKLASARWDIQGGFYEDACRLRPRTR